MNTPKVYRCEVCGNIVEMMHVGGGQLVCCNQPMVELVGNTTDAALEKHVPVIEPIEGGYRVSVGSVLHPMTDNHYIEFIEFVADGVVYRKNLKPGDQPVAEFMVEATEYVAREWCTLHGFWRNN